MDTAVIIPSYNSAPWITKLVRRILKQKRVRKIIIVDDNSPDGSGRLITTIFGKSGKVKLITRKEKGGRGGAVVRGFVEALKLKSVKFVVEMDSDLAHNPSDIPRFLTRIKGKGLIIGSRYHKGGKTVDYGKGRRLFSLIANKYASFLLEVPITDYTSGYRCYRREALEEIDLNNIKTKGFITLSEMAYKAHKKGHKIAEIPISVTYHPAYKSNLDLKEILDAFFGIIRIRLFS